MSYLSIFQRVVPFLLTFAAGLLIASIFVPIAAPSFSGGEGRGNRCREHKRAMYFEYESLRQERDQLREEVDQLRREAADADFKNLKFIVPEVNVEAPPPPPPPAKRPRNPHAQ